jgi:hypothetical protein
MIPFNELVFALERYRRRQAGEDVPEREEPRERSGRNHPAEQSAEIPIDELVDDE